ncbi:MAG: hypothetical protein PHC94_11860 [Methylobacter sp.]|nr:hypothetical protein [Methylobacter sp.]
MSAATNCEKGENMPEVWAVIVSVIVLLVIWGIISSKLKARKRRKAREKSLPYVEDNIHPGVQYNVNLNDGRKFLAVELVGSSTIDDGQFSFAGWEGMLVLKQADGKRIFLKQSAVRFIEEI